LPDRLWCLTRRLRRWRRLLWDRDPPLLLIPDRLLRLRPEQLPLPRRDRRRRRLELPREDDEESDLLRDRRAEQPLPSSSPLPRFVPAPLLRSGSAPLSLSAPLWSASIMAAWQPGVSKLGAVSCCMYSRMKSLPGQPPDPLQGSKGIGCRGGKPGGGGPGGGGPGIGSPVGGIPGGGSPGCRGPGRSPGL